MSPLFIISACWLGLVSAWVVPSGEDPGLHFDLFIHYHGKKYADEYEKQARFQIFKENFAKVIEMNEKSKYASYGITKFMDLTEEEFTHMYTGFKGPIDYDDSPCKILHDQDIPDVDTPESFDWRDHDVVSRVKNQANCGSCWAFSSTGNIESQVAIKYKKHVELSEQQIVDCDTASGGCVGGGFMTYAFGSIIEKGGIESEVDYPYTGNDGSCSFNKDKVSVKLTDCRAYNLTSQEKVKQLLVKYGPIAIAVASRNIQNYHGGVITDDDCGENRVDHAVLLVGYGKDEVKNMPYWIVKNSWEKKWGEDGYFRMQRGENAISCGMMNPDMAMAIIE